MDFRFEQLLRSTSNIWGYRCGNDLTTQEAKWRQESHHHGGSPGKTIFVLVRGGVLRKQVEKNFLGLARRGKRPWLDVGSRHWPIEIGKSNGRRGRRLCENGRRRRGAVGCLDEVTGFYREGGGVGQGSGGGAMVNMLPLAPGSAWVCV